MTVDIPDDLWEFLEQHARRKRTRAADLLSKVLNDYRRLETTSRSTSLALKGYGARPEERKTRSR
jgi:hypothetical protein